MPLSSVFLYFSPHLLSSNTFKALFFFFTCFYPLFFHLNLGFPNGVFPREAFTTGNVLDNNPFLRHACPSQSFHSTRFFRFSMFSATMCLCISILPRSINTFRVYAIVSNTASKFLSIFYVTIEVLLGSNDVV